MSPSSVRTTDPGWWEDWPWRLIQTNLRELDMEDIDAERYVESLRELHATVAMINTSGIVASYPTALPFHTPSAFLHGDGLATIIEACHEAGIKVIARTDFSKVRQALHERHPEWAYRQADGGIVDEEGDVYVCPSGGYQQECAPRIVEETITDARRRRHLLQHGRLPDARLPRGRSRDLPLRCLRRGVPRACSAWRSRPPRTSRIRSTAGTSCSRSGRALIEATDGRDDPPAAAGPRDRPAVRRWRRVRPAGVEHGARSPAPRVAVQRVGQHEVGGELAPAHGLEQQLGGLRRLPGPARRRVAGAAASAARAGARERRRPRLLRDRPAGPSPRSVGRRRRSRAVRLPRRARGRVSRPPLVRADRAPHRRSRERRGVPRVVPGARRAPLPLRRRCSSTPRPTSASRGTTRWSSPTTSRSPTTRRLGSTGSSRAAGPSSRAAAAGGGTRSSNRATAPALACLGIERIREVRATCVARTSGSTTATAFPRLAGTDLVFLDGPYVDAEYRPEAAAASCG